MTCPYTEFQLEVWDGVCTPMGEVCYSCEEFGCEHNANEENPEVLDLGEYEGFFKEE